MPGLAVVAAILGMIALERLGAAARSSGEALTAPTMPPAPR
jgi:hypothetical protein